MKILFFIISLCLSFLSYSQNISGKVVDDKGPVSGATITFFSKKDSVAKKFLLSESDGRFSLSLPDLQQYFFCISHTGYSKTCHTGLNANSEDLTVVLAKEEKSLADVTVTGRRPLIEARADRMIINVEGTINNIGNSALDILKKSPGVSIDNDDNLSLAGKNGVQVFIDGRPSPLTGSDLSSYLSSLQSSQLDAIEIITNPSAKYEAAGNAGIINIRLKKNKSFGTNGSVNTGFGIGYYPKYNAGFSLNHRNKHINIFGTYTYTQAYNYIATNTIRHLGDSTYEGRSVRLITDKPHNIQAGLDYFINPNTTVGILINAVPGLTYFDNYTNTYIRSKAGTFSRRLEGIQANAQERKNTNVNVNYRYGTATHEWNIDLDYGTYNFTSDQLQPNNYYDAGNNYLSSLTYHMVSPSDITMKSIKSNYDFNWLSGKWSIGGKYGVIKSENNLQRYNVVNNNEKYDSARSNTFTYNEQVSAGFIRFSKEWQNISFQAGLRMEQTNITGYSHGFIYQNSFRPYDSTFTRSYLDAFPSLSIGIKISPDQQLSFNAGRRIDRPPYSDLNPFEFKLDDYLSRRGNTNLKPQYTTILEAVHIYKNRLTTILSYSHVKDVFTQIFDTVDRTKTFITKTNVSAQDVYSVSMNYTFAGRKASGFFNLNPFYSTYVSNFGPGRDLNLKAFSYLIKGQIGYKFRNGYSAEISGSYTSAGIGLGFFEGEPFGNIDLALAKNFIENRLSVKAAMSDLFFTNKIKAVSSFAGQQMEVERSFEPRLFRINFSYKFGSNTVKAARQRKTLADEENKRLQVSN